jgi:hypothetical protein
VTELLLKRAVISKAVLMVVQQFVDFSCQPTVRAACHRILLLDLSRVPS